MSDDNDILASATTLEDLELNLRAQREAWIEEIGGYNKWLIGQAVEKWEEGGQLRFMTVCPSRPYLEEVYGPLSYKRLPRKVKKKLSKSPFYGHAKSIFPDLLPMYNGYVLFKDKPVVEPELHGILSYVPVFGGITLAHHDDMGSMYGFDTTHPRFHDEPTESIDWMKQQIDTMVRGILVAGALEEEYLKADGDNEARGRIANRIREVDPSISLSMGAMINLLSGEL